MLRCFYIYIAFGTFTNIAGVVAKMCYTSYVGEENFLDPVLTTCPLRPELSDMLSITLNYVNATQP